MCFLVQPSTLPHAWVIDFGCGVEVSLCILTPLPPSPVSWPRSRLCARMCAQCITLWSWLCFHVLTLPSMLSVTAARTLFLCAPVSRRQCLDESLTNEVPKVQLTSFTLAGASECHAPELLQELKEAKAEVCVSVADSLASCAWFGCWFTPCAACIA